MTRLLHYILRHPQGWVARAWRAGAHRVRNEDVALCYPGLGPLVVMLTTVLNAPADQHLAVLQSFVGQHTGGLKLRFLMWLLAGKLDEPMDDQLQPGRAPRAAFALAFRARGRGLSSREIHLLSRVVPPEQSLTQDAVTSYLGTALWQFLDPQQL